MLVTSEHVSALLLVLLVVAGAVALWILQQQLHSEYTKAAQERLPSKIKVDAVEVGLDGTVVLYIRTLDDYTSKVQTFYLVDPVSDLALAVYNYEVTLSPGNVTRVLIPSYVLKGTSLPERSYLVLKTGSATSLTTVAVVPRQVLEQALAREFPKLAYRAYESSSNLNINHYVVLDPVRGDFRLHDDPTGKDFYGKAPLITDSEVRLPGWVPWSNRPFDSPVIVAVNPTYARRDWVFTVNLAGQPYRFYLQALGEEALGDYLLLWEDLYNPFRPPSSVDDWMDHVVRVTLFENGTLRVAILRAKGGYRQAFYVGLPSINAPPAHPSAGCCSSSISNIGRLPCGDSCVYCKDFNAYWQVVSGGYYREFYVTSTAASP